MKMLKVSFVTIMSILPMVASAANIEAASKANISTNTNVATTSFVGGAHDALVDEINTNRAAINTLNGDANTAGSVANSIATAVAGKQDTIDSTHKLGADLVDDSTSTNKFVTASDKTTWNAKQAQLTNGTANVGSTVGTSVRATGTADDTTLVTEKAVRDAITSAAYDDTALSGRVDGLESAVGDSSSGLVKDVADLQSAVGDSNGGLVKDVADLQSAVGDSNGGLVKDVADNASDISALQSAIGDSTDGLVKDVADLQSAVGDSNGGLVKDVADNASDISALQSAVGDSNGGLVKDVADNASDISALQSAVGDSTDGLVKDVADLQSAVGDSNSGLIKDVADLQSANNTAKGFNVFGSWATPTTSTGSVTVSSTGLTSND